MTVEEMIEALEGLVEQGVDPATELRLLHQRNYPLQFLVDGLGVLPSERKMVQQREALNEVAVRNNIDVTDLDEPEKQAPYADEVKVVYIVEGSHPYSPESPYGPSFDEMMDPGEVEEDPDLEEVGPGHPDYDESDEPYYDEDSGTGEEVVTEFDRQYHDGKNVHQIEDDHLSRDQGHYIEDDHLSRAEREDRRYEMKFGADAGAD